MKTRAYAAACPARSLQLMCAFSMAASIPPAAVAQGQSDQIRGVEGAGGTARERQQGQQGQQGQQQPVNPYTVADSSWLSISGTVETVRPDEFTLDYGEGRVVVEMDDSDRDADAYVLMQGDNVTVDGVMDDDMFERATIEASSVFVEKLGTRFYSSPLDEEDYDRIRVPMPVDPSLVSVQGRVTEVSGGEFAIDTGLRSVAVDVDEMPYDPFDDEGYQKIEVGDIVIVSGDVDEDFLEGREIEAQAIITLVEEVG